MSKIQITNNVVRGKIANCIALHDFAAKPDLKKWTDYVLDFFAEYNIVPNKMTSPNPNSRKNITFKRAITKLAKANYEVEDIWIGALPTDSSRKYDDSFDSIFSAIIMLERKTSSALCFADNICKFEVAKINELAKCLAEITSAQYGYVYQRSFSRGPTFYSAGIIAGLVDPDEHEQKLITKWLDAYIMSRGYYKTGDLRDIYPINILSSAHMEREIFPNKTFKDWIESSENHGHLQQLNNELWSWYVSDELISPVRESLRPTGMVLCI